MQKIRLQLAEWEFDESKLLGPPGGFGEVFHGSGSGGPVAIKRLMVSIADAHRELDIANQLLGKSHKHVVPILDSGQDADSDRYFLVMPICDGSLADFIRKNGPSDPTIVAQTLLEIVAGLREVAGLVHRDLKPANVLRLDDRWVIADLGISKFADNSTSSETLRDVRTNAYAAPEQWRLERPTSATDVYALGCIAHALVTGSPPFAGVADLADAHLNQVAPPLGSGNTQLDAFVQLMLRKPAGVRPSLQRCQAVLESIATQRRRSQSSALAAAGLKASQEKAEAEALANLKKEMERQHAEIFSEGCIVLSGIIDRLFDQIALAAPSAEAANKAILLRDARLQFGNTERTFFEDERFLGAPVTKSWHVVGYAAMQLVARNAPNEHGAYSWRATLILARSPSHDEYRWYEVGFWQLGGLNRDVPIALAPDHADFDAAIAGRIAKDTRLAYGPLAIDGEDEAYFQDRWSELFGLAANNQLTKPNRMPLTPDYFERLLGRS